MVPAMTWWLGRALRVEPGEDRALRQGAWPGSADRASACTSGSRPRSAAHPFLPQEGANINKSLTTLGKVISALAEMVSWPLASGLDSGEGQWRRLPPSQVWRGGCGPRDSPEMGEAAPGVAALAPPWACKMGMRSPPHGPSEGHHGRAEHVGGKLMGGQWSALTAVGPDQATLQPSKEEPQPGR